MSERRGRRAWALVMAVVCAGSVAGAGCGSRLDRARLERSLGSPEGLRPAGTAGPASAANGPVAGQGVSGHGSVGGGATGPGAAGAGLGGGSDSNGGSGLNGGSGSGRGSGSSAPAGAGPGRPSSGAGGRADASSGSGGGTSGSAAGGPSGTRAGAGPASAASGTGSGGTGGPAAPSPGPGARSAPGPTGAEIRLGSVGVQSGVLGATMAPFFLGARAWVADVTARGGLAGHPVRLIMGDDGGDPAKAQTLVHRMVEQDKVQAFYTVPAPTTLQAITPYLEQQQIPIIGLCECNPAVDESPMAFQPGIGSTTGLAWAHLAPLVGMTDKRKLSIFYCREVASCPQSAEGIKRLAGPVGVQVVHEVQMSLAQPDYTAEVLSARNAGADAIIVVADNATIVRILRSAHRQGYHPQVSTPTAGYEPRFIHSGGDDVEGTVVASSTVPWSTSPRMADYRAAMARFVPGGELSTLGAEMWGSGKLIEVLARRFPANPTSADFLDALYALRGETVGGIFPPLAFVKGQGHVATNQCVVPVKVVGGQFKPLSDDQFSCAPGWRPVTP